MIRNILIVVLFFNSSLCDESTVEVKTSVALVKGKTVNVLNKTINQFLGIPFAEPPVGRLRFGKPEPRKTRLNEVIDATKPKFSCLQNDDQLSFISKASEDCLVMNIWSPKSNSSALKPVMFWIYGGGFKSGAIDLPTYDGKLLATYDVVIVSVNYRVGPFGFLYGAEESAPGNAGLYDQLLALKWVKEHIRSFGGDPNAITLFGESAGGFSASAHVLSPLSRGLFRRAILQSGALFDDKRMGNLNTSEALTEAKRMAKHFNCSDNKWLDCLRKVDAKTLNSYKDLNVFLITGTDYLPLNSQNSFKTHNYSRDIEIMAGVVQNEGSLLAHLFYPKSDSIKTIEDFKDVVKSVKMPELDVQNITQFYLKNRNTNSSDELKKGFYDFYGDVRITCPTYLFAKQFAEQSPKSNVFFYEWTYPGQLMGPLMGCTKNMGVCHASDLEFVFGLSVISKSKDSDFSKDVMKMWTNFAKYGQPMKDWKSEAKWPRIIESGVKNAVPKFKEINPLKPNNIFENLFAKTCDDFWKNYFV